MTKGKHKINGVQALEFVRQRHFLDAAATSTRVKRQQYFLTAAFRKVASAGILTKLNALGTPSSARHLDPSLEPARPRAPDGEPQRQQHHRQDDPDDARRRSTGRTSCRSTRPRCASSSSNALNPPTPTAAIAAPSHRRRPRRPHGRHDREAGHRQQVHPLTPPRAASPSCWPPSRPARSSPTTTRRAASAPSCRSSRWPTGSPRRTSCWWTSSGSAPATRALIDLPAHWISVPILLGCLTAGLALDRPTAAPTSRSSPAPDAPAAGRAGRLRDRADVGGRRLPRRRRRPARATTSPRCVRRPTRGAACACRGRGRRPCLPGLTRGAVRRARAPPRCRAGAPGADHPRHGPARRLAGHRCSRRWPSRLGGVRAQLRRRRRARAAARRRNARPSVV